MRTPRLATLRQQSTAGSLSSRPRRRPPAPPAHTLTPTPTHARCARASQAIKALAQLYLAVHPAAIRAVAALAQQSGVPPPDMLEPDFLRAVALAEAEARREGMEED